MTVGNEYSRIHYAVRKMLLKVCSRCGKSGPVDAALKPNADPSRLKVDDKSGCRYSIDLSDYYALCSPCHHRVDLVEQRQLCKNGHPYTTENTRYTTTGRKCRTCHRNQEKTRLQSDTARQVKSESDRRYRLKNPMSDAQKARKLELQRQRRAAASARFERF